MQLDSSNSHTTADEATCSQTIGNEEPSKGKCVNEPDNATGPVVEKCPEANDDTWCYLFVHHRKVTAFEQQLTKDHRSYFIHTSIKYAPKRGNAKGIKKIVVQTVSGLIFLKGRADELQKYLDDKFPFHRLCRNCSTGKVAEIPNEQMQPFMRVVKSNPDRIRFLMRPFVYYSQNRTLLRITSGDFAGLEGYVMRIARDRKIVIDVGGMGVAIGGIHAERFEEVGKNESTKQDRATFHKRNLHERNAFIDRYFHKVATAHDVAAQAENIDILRLQTLADAEDGSLGAKEAFETLCFVIEEIGYYYAPFIDRMKELLGPILDAGRKVMQDLGNIISFSAHDGELRQHWESEFEALRINYGYLFE